jgi:hypothetical protein
VFSAVDRDSSGLSRDPVVRDSTRAIARRTVEARNAPLMSIATAFLASRGFVEDLPVLIDALGADSLTYAHAVLALARATGAGVDSMPRHHGTRASRAAAHLWWERWYLEHRDTFVPATHAQGLAAWFTMFDKIYKHDR